MTVYFADGSIIGGSRSQVRRAIKLNTNWERTHYDRNLPYWFSKSKCEENYKKFHTWG